MVDDLDGDLADDLDEGLDDDEGDLDPWDAVLSVTVVEVE